MPFVNEVPWIGVRRIENSRMVEIDVYWFFWASMSVYPLHSIEAGVPLAAVAAQLGLARVALETFGEDAVRVFPNTAAKAKEMTDCIDKMIPREPSMVQNRLVTPWEATTLRNTANTLTSTLRDESKRNYVLCIENQRCLSAHSLVEKIENCFSPESWDAIGKDAKREFEEAGKCLGVERYTAAGFHSLRGVECVIRQFIVELTGALPKKRDWGHYVEVLRQNGADNALIAVLDNIRSLERNPLMHPEDWLTIDESIGMFTISHSAIDRLVSDMKRKRASKSP